MSGSIFAGDTGLGVISIVAVVAVIAMVLLSRLIKRDQDVKTTRFGWFIERERYSEEQPWPQLDTPPPQRTLPIWPDLDKTADLPPKAPG